VPIYATASNPLEGSVWPVQTCQGIARGRCYRGVTFSRCATIVSVCSAERPTSRMNRPRRYALRIATITSASPVIRSVRPLMRTPNTKRIVETFIPIGSPNDANRLRNQYFDLLRSRVSPLVADLRQQGCIGWFSFLVHDRKTGRIPVPEADTRCFIHLRFERLPRISFDRLRDSLPDICKYTRPMRARIDRSLGAAAATALIEPRIATGWALFGSSSEWVLRFVCAHREGQAIPDGNVCQFFHYIENQLLVQTMGCRLQCP
jgi:hypothetical protein